MGIYDIDSAVTTSMQDQNYVAGQEPWNKNLDSISIESQGTDINNYTTDWEKWHGMYRTIPEKKVTIDILCRWIISKKIEADKNTKAIIDRIRGNGKDTFRKILLNLKRTSKICGDAHAEKMKDKAGRLINLKPLDSGTIRTVASNRGVILRYEQIVNKNEKIEVLNTWEPDEIFHVINNRIADEIHGIPELEALQKITKWRHQSMGDNSVIIHRYGKPTFFFEMDTDNTTEIANAKTIIDNAMKNFENVILPKGTLDEIKKASSNQMTTIDAMPWIKFLTDYYTLSSGTPDIIQGMSRETSLAAGKLNYLAWKEKIEQEQIDFEEDIEAQLGLKIKFERPVDIDIEIGNKAGTNTNAQKQIQGGNKDEKQKE